MILPPEAQDAVETSLELDILPQPDDSTCGPTCLHAVYGFYDDDLPLEQVIAEVATLEAGGTLAVMLGVNALKRGYEARINTFNLQVFDPTWFQSDDVDIAERLRLQADAKHDDKLQAATRSYLRFLELGGELYFEDLTPNLVRRHLKRGVPLLTGLSATYLYRCARERGEPLVHDDVAGVPQGHFVVLCGYDPEEREVLVADPLLPNPVAATHRYHVKIERLINAILLGILTYDANLLVIEPRKKARSKPDGHPPGGR
jgi:hypothetical protein